MLSRLIGGSLRHRFLVLALAALLIGWGAFIASRSRLDVFPEFVPPQVVVQTESPGLSPEQVELLVTRPVEQALGGLAALESLRSQSVPGLSIVTVTFADGTNLIQARQLLSERLALAAAQLPAGIQPPRMSPLTSATMDLLSVGFTSDALSPMDLRTFVDTVVRPRVLAVPGVASTVEFGGELRQLQILLRPERLAAFGVTVPEVLDAARRATGVLGAGYVETDAQRILVQSEGQALDAAQLGAVTVSRRAGLNVRLMDVARVIEGPALKFGDCLIQGQPGVLFKGLSQFGANTLETTRDVEAALAELQPALAASGVTLHPGLFRPASFIEAALGNIGRALLLGGALVALVLFLFLLNFRTALISLTAIPLSLLSAVAVLHMIGASLNTMTLGGLVIALGEVVDDAIIDVENILRRLRANARAAAPLPAARVVLLASLEVRTAVVFATLIVCVVFLPVLTMSGLEGRLFAPLGLAYVLAVLASLLVALTVTPALTLLLLGRRAGSQAEPVTARWARSAYAALLAPLLAHPWRVSGVVLFLCLAAAGIARGFGGEFLPELREGAVVMHANLAPGTSLSETMRVGGRISQALLAEPLIATVPLQAGRAEQGEDPWGPHRTEWHVNLAVKNSAEEDAAHESIRRVLDGFPGISYDLTTFLGDRISESISGEPASVVISLFGEDLDALDVAAAQVARAASGVRGAVDVQLSAPPGVPQLEVSLRFDRLQQLGFQPVEVLEAVQAAFQGVRAGQVYQGLLTEDVVVRLDDDLRRDPEAVAGLTVSSASGVRVPLSALAYVSLSTGRAMVQHEGARRRQTVTCNVTGRDVAGFAAELERTVARAVELPPGVYAQFGGEAQARAQAHGELLLRAAMAGFAVLLLLSLVTGHWRNLLLVLANLPFALVGGVLAVAVTGGTLSVGSMVGMVTLFGITVRNSLMMISHFRHLVREEGMTWGREAALRGASERLMPILMTALVTALGLLPIALGGGRAGSEIESQMAIVILGGLITSTALNLFVMPTLALRLGRFAGRREEKGRGIGGGPCPPDPLP